jgi:hypothetical protein
MPDLQSAYSWIKPRRVALATASFRLMNTNIAPKTRGFDRLESLARWIAGAGGEVAYAHTDVRRKC